VFFGLPEKIVKPKIDRIQGLQKCNVGFDVLPSQAANCSNKWPHPIPGAGFCTGQTSTVMWPMNQSIAVQLLWLYNMKVVCRPQFHYEWAIGVRGCIRKVVCYTFPHESVDDFPWLGPVLQFFSFF